MQIKNNINIQRGRNRDKKDKFRVVIESLVDEEAFMINFKEFWQVREKGKKAFYREKKKEVQTWVCSGPIKSRVHRWGRW